MGAVKLEAVVESVKPRDIELTMHFKERFVQRVYGQSDMNGKELEQYIRANDTKLVYDAIMLLSEAKHLWCGKVNDQHQMSNFEISGDIIIVMDSNKKTAITCYRIELPFPLHISRKLIKDLTDHIFDLKRQSYELGTIHLPRIQAVQEERKRAKEQIQQLQARLIELDEIEAKERQIVNQFDPEIDEMAVILCNSLQFKMDLLKTGFKRM